MEIYFFTAVDDNPLYQAEADILIASGRRFGRTIHRHRIPAGALWNRYKVNLFAGDLPPADRYVYLDSDTVLTGPGDWEARDCQGVADFLWYIDHKPLKCQHTNGAMRNHTVCIGEGQGYEYLSRRWHEWGEPIWCNSGVVVLDAAVRQPFAELWRRWMAIIDRQCEKGFMVGDEASLMFARQGFDLPLLPPRFNYLCKWQPPLADWHSVHLIHADGNVTGAKRQPYIDAVAALGLGDPKGETS